MSKTAYLNNYELDRLFEIDCNNPEEQGFINWFEKFKSECIKIEEIICMADVKMKLHLCKEPDKFKFAGMTSGSV